jgi:hypothetical protein
MRCLPAVGSAMEAASEPKQDASATTDDDFVQ